MGIVSPGFKGRPRSGREKLPPGQYLVTDFPVLSAGPTPRVKTRTWEFRITTETGEVHTWDWAAFQALPAEEFQVDLHCVTKWSKLHTTWRGVSMDTLLAQAQTSAEYALARSYGGYTTNLPLADLLDGQAWVAKWVQGIDLRTKDEPGFWESLGYNNYGDPWREQRYWGD
jgi:DMSO/TMAO reductase YedYZ molybdopterin-dependent catalytic subunit